MAIIKWKVSETTMMDFRTLMVRVSEAEQANDLPAYWEAVEMVKMLPGFPAHMNLLQDEVHLILDRPIILVH